MKERSVRIAAKRTFHRQDERGRESAAVKGTLGGKRTSSGNQRDLRDKRDESDAIRGTLRAYTGIGDKRDKQSWREAFTLRRVLAAKHSLDLRESAAVKETLGGTRTFSDNQRDLRDQRDESDATRGTLRAYTGIGDKRDRQA